MTTRRSTGGRPRVRLLVVGLCGSGLLLAACSGSGGGSDAGTTPAAGRTAGVSAARTGAGSAPSGPAAQSAGQSVAQSAGEQDVDATVAAPTSCDTVRPLVQRDLGFTVTKANFAPDGETPDGAPASTCEAYGGTSTVVDVIYAVEDDSQQALGELQDAKEFAPHIGLTPHDLTGPGDQAFYVTDSTDTFAWMALVTGNAVVFLRSVRGSVALAKWEALAKDAVAGMA